MLTRRIALFGMWPQTLWVVEQTWQGDDNYCSTFVRH